MEALDNLIYMNGYDESLKERATFLSDSYYGDDYGLEDEEMSTGQDVSDIGTFSFPSNPHTTGKPLNTPFGPSKKKRKSRLYLGATFKIFDPLTNGKNLHMIRTWKGMRKNGNGG